MSARKSETKSISEWPAPCIFPATAGRMPTVEFPAQDRTPPFVRERRAYIGQICGRTHILISCSVPPICGGISPTLPAPPSNRLMVVSGTGSAWTMYVVTAPAGPESVFCQPYHRLQNSARMALDSSLQARISTQANQTRHPDSCHTC